jgi:hypothetical protein
MQERRHLLTAKKESEFQKFDRTMRELIKVPHDEIKAKLDAEKTARKRKAKKPSASDREQVEKD